MPSSPYGPCSSGKHDVDLAERLGHRAGLAVDDLAVGRVDGEHDGALAPTRRAAPRSAARGRRWPSAPGSSAASAQRPSRVMPIGRTSYFVAVDGRAARLPAVTHRDRVLGAAAAEDDGHPRLAGVCRGSGVRFSVLISR